METEFCLCLFHFVDGVYHIITDSDSVIMVEVELHISDFQIGKVDHVID